MLRRLKAPTVGKNVLNRSFISINSLIPCVFAWPESEIIFRAKVSISLSTSTNCSCRCIKSPKPAGRDINIGCQFYGLRKFRWMYAAECYCRNG